MSRRPTRSISMSSRSGRPIPNMRLTRPQTAGLSGLPPSLPTDKRSATPPGRLEHPKTPVGLSGPGVAEARRASTPELGNTSSSSSVPMFLDDTDVSTIPTSSAGAIPRTVHRSANERLLEHKQNKKDLERKALLAQMYAALASVELYEEQQAKNSPREQAKIDQLKSEMTKEEKLVETYSTCLEVVPLLMKAEAAIDSVKVKRDIIQGVLHGSDGGVPCTEQETAKICEDLKHLKSSVGKVKSALIAKRISLPFGELEKALKHSAEIFGQIDDHTQFRRGMKKVTELVTLMNQLVLKLEKIEGLQEEKDRFTVHLASLNTSLMLYNRMKGSRAEK